MEIVRYPFYYKIFIFLLLCFDIWLVWIMLTSGNLLYQLFVILMAYFAFVLLDFLSYKVVFNFQTKSVQMSNFFLRYLVNKEEIEEWKEYTTRGVAGIYVTGLPSRTWVILLKNGKTIVWPAIKLRYFVEHAVDIDEHVSKVIGYTPKNMGQINTFQAFKRFGFHPALILKM